MSGASANESITETDHEAVELLHHVLLRLAELVNEHERVYPVALGANSVLAADDMATHPLEIGHFASYCLLQAVDTCRSIVRVVRDEAGGITLPIMSLFTLARAVIECAATAMWVMAPPDRRTRVVRRLQFEHNELSHETELTKSAASSFSKSEEQAALRKDAKSRKKANAYMRAIAHANGIARTEYENTRPGREEIVTVAGEAMSIEHHGLPTVWRLCSGLSHPSVTRGINVLQFTQTSEKGDILSGVLSVKTGNAVSVVSLAHRATTIAMKHWSLSKVQVNPERPVPKPVVPKL
ncbi:MULTISPECIES: hypothetical protein [Microbacterium]|uniref:Uncharacterized protein n=1 Tax=Microbacterium wangchenii TaxID=2541726 RepID=A0ABX5SWE6_9MICO|nr:MULTISPECIES: hypothetical protein [Microbacterium]MCK6068502.1 hypothetical protein [Microbacterium sp. EYE_512]QBR89149.1 hypothetical protein E4K62_10910 [Microbacterium wangchenii]TXK09219.1 hypothetical protein FVP99_18285 [Microbacterium wangchenii]